MNAEDRQSLTENLREKPRYWRAWVYTHYGKLHSSREFLTAIEEMNSDVWDKRLE